MKIFNNSNITQIMKLYNKSIKPTEKTEGLNPAEDKLDLSQKGKEFQIALKAYKELPDIRQDKVEALKEKIQNKSYSVSGKEVLDKILEGIVVDKKV